MNKRSHLISNSQDINLDWFNDVSKVGITAGASAPEQLVQEVIRFIQSNFATKIHNIEVTTENIRFNLPLELRG